MDKLLNSIHKEMICVLFFIFFIFILMAVLISINTNSLLGYYSPGFLGWSGYWPWSGPVYGGLYGSFGYGGGYPYSFYPYFGSSYFLYNPSLWGSIWPSWNIYEGLWSYPYARPFGELLLVVPPAGDPIFIDEEAIIITEETLIAAVSGFLDVALGPEELVGLTDPILNVLAANPNLLPEFWLLYPDLAITNPDLYAAILIL
ncbi:MAG: hypothetical protein ACMUIM_11740 [bacterium]